MRLQFVLRFVRRLARTSCIFVGLVGGCCWSICSTCNDCGGEFGGRGLKRGALRDAGQEPAAHGSSVNAWVDEQANRAEASDFTIFLNEWYMGGTDLGPFGLHHLGDIARRAPNAPFPIVIQPHLDSALNESRRQIIVNSLTQQGIADAESRVIVAYPQAEGLYGEEGEIVYYDMFLNRSGYNSGYGFGSGNYRRMGAWGYGGAGGMFGRGLFGGGYGGNGGYGGYGWGRGGWGIPGGYYDYPYVR